jgi:serine phosphatase RsbU (regulator of sigma subunit)
VVVGLQRDARPNISELPLAAGTLVVAFTDGLSHAGSVALGPGLDPLPIIRALVEAGELDPQRIVESLLSEAVEREQGRPRDDISIMAVAAVPRQGDSSRRMSGRLPL